MKKLFTSLLLILFFAVSAQAKTITLSWDASPSTDVTGYNIYAGSDPDVETLILGTPIDVGIVLTYQFLNVEDEAKQYFAVTAYDAAGNESIYSNIVVSEALDVTPPLPPSGLLLSGGGN